MFGSQIPQIASLGRPQEVEVRDQRSEVRSQRSEIRGQKSEVRGQRSDSEALGILDHGSEHSANFAAEGSKFDVLRGADVAAISCEIHWLL